jgi:hypothetical protein
VPAEAHRLQRRVGDRDRRFFAALAGAAAIAAGIGAVAVHGAGSAAAQQCVTRHAAGALGGGTWRFCGAQALAFCRAHASEDRRLARRCASLTPDGS